MEADAHIPAFLPQLSASFHLKLSFAPSVPERVPPWLKITKHSQSKLAEYVYMCHKIFSGRTATQNIDHETQTKFLLSPSKPNAKSYNTDSPGFIDQRAYIPSGNRKNYPTPTFFFES